MSHRILPVAAALAAALGLSACESGHKPVAGLCKAFPAAPPAATDGAAVMDDCLHRWSYALAGGGDDAETIGAAAVAACSAPLSRWNQQGLAAPTPDAPSLLTGETTNAIAEHAAFAHNRALFYVVQARAGGCKAPPRRDNAAAMTTPDA